MNVISPLLIRFLQLSLMFCLATASLVAQGEPGPLDFTYSYSVFAHTDSSTLVEFIIQFSDQGLRYPSSGAEKDGRLYTRLQFRDIRSNDTLVADWVTAAPRPGAGDAPRAMLGTQRIALPPGDYAVQLYFQDVADKSRRDSAMFNLNVPSFAGSRLQLSDLQVIAEASQSGNHSSPFFKQGYEVVPNVTGTITPPFLVLNTYMEVYNADKSPTSEYQISYRLADTAKRVFFQTQVSRPRPQGRVAVEMNTIPLDSLPSGTYFIVVKAYNGLARAATDSTIVFRSFQLSNPDIDSMMVAMRRGPIMPAVGTKGGSDIIDPIYAGLREEELNEEYGKVKYIATDMEKGTWDNLSGIEAKGRFLTRFWQVRDHLPATPENENRDLYYQRVADARSLYSAPMTPKGWDSDRGRVLLQYGKPDNIDRHFQDFNRKPFEIWTYARENYEFVFVDRTQTGFYRLVHSTAPAEPRFENWEMEYAQMGKNWKDRNDR